MLDFNPAEFLIVGIVALLVIGPKDLPKAMRFIGQWIGKARGVARQFRSGFDTMIRESELADMEKRWAEENARIMRDYPSTPDLLAQPENQPKTGTEQSKAGPAPVAAPVIVDQPAGDAVGTAAAPATASAADTADMLDKPTQ